MTLADSTGSVALARFDGSSRDLVNHRAWWLLFRVELVRGFPFGKSTACYYEVRPAFSGDSVKVKCLWNTTHLVGFGSV